MLFIVTNRRGDQARDTVDAFTRFLVGTNQFVLEYEPEFFSTTGKNVVPLNNHYRLAPGAMRR